MRTLYQPDLAWLHHHAYGDFARNAAPQLLRILRKSGIRRGTIVDLACGSGIWPDAAIRAGFDVVAVDRSKAMLRLAKSVAPKARLHCASLHDFKIPPCDVVTIIGEGIQYLQPTEKSAPATGKFFHRVAKALRPGGMFIFDAIAEPRAPMNYTLARVERDWAVFVKATQKRTSLIRQIVTFRKVARTWRRADETHRVWLVNIGKITAELRASGFQVTVSRKYGALDLAPNRIAFIAQKPG